MKQCNEEHCKQNGCYLVTRFSSNPTNRFILSELSFLAKVIEKLLDVQVRKRKYSLRSIVNAIITDGGYRGKRLSDTLKATLGYELEVTLRPDECPSKFQVMPKRWIVEKIISYFRNTTLIKTF